MTATPGNLPALILAAGRGERMRPLSDARPKPLLPVGGRPMIEWHLRALAAAGVRRVVINTAWLEEQFPAALGDGSRFGVEILWSHEGRNHGGALETAGGIATALPLLGTDGAFWVVAGDIVAPRLRFEAVAAQQFAASGDDALLWLTPNPPFHPRGDFALAGSRVRRPAEGEPRPLTFTSVALVQARLVDGIAAGTKAALGPLLFAAAARGRLGGRLIDGPWHNVGTPQQLAEADAALRAADFG